MHYRKHIRLPNYNYSQNGYYFVTICTYMRRPIFINAPPLVAAASYAAKMAAQSAPQGGAATNHGTVDIKSLVQQKIKQIPEYYQGVEIDYSEVMPAHIHMILILQNANTSLPKIINAFKSWVTRDINRVTTHGAAQGAATTTNKILIWQPNYYEHIIRNESALNRIREYIINNPEKEIYDWDKLDM